jgi:predicted phosphodiesterase
MANATRSEPAAPEPARVARIGLIGDVHTERVRLQGVLAHFATLELDLIVCTGDLPDGPHDARDVDACVSSLRAAGVVAVSGNHERWLQDDEMRDLPGAIHKDELQPETLAWLAALPHRVELSTPHGLALLCHGLDDDDMGGVKPHDHGYALENNEALQALLRAGRYRYVLNGHTHWPMVRAFGALIVVNAGTLLGSQGPCCAVLDFAQRVARYHAVDEHGVVSAEPEREHSL